MDSLFRLPVWARVLNEFGRRIGYEAGLEEKELLATARQRTGLWDFGEDYFREPLRILLRAWQTEAGLTPIGRWLVRQEALLRLSNRLKIQDTLRRHPEILSCPLREPLVITGMPRTGTTLLHNLLSQDPQARPLLFWEGRRPAPPPTPETYRRDPRVARSKWELRVGTAMIPEVLKAHWAESDGPAECNGLFQNGFASPLFGVMASIPSYGEWLRACDPLPVYREYRRQLQLLSWKFPGRRWVLKAPAHMFCLESLRTALPEARLVFNHRDPLEVLPSLCSLVTRLRVLQGERIDLQELVDQTLEGAAVAAERFLAFREGADPGCCYDVHYPGLLADPVATVHSLCNHFGLAFSPEVERGARRWLAENPQHKHGLHRYSAEQFGLAGRRLDERLEAYRAWLIRAKK